MPIFVINTLEHENGQQPRTLTAMAHTPEEVADALQIPVIAEIEPQTDEIYGHTFKWPAEVAQFITEQANHAG